MVLVMENAVPPTKDVAARIAADTLAKRGPDYTNEVRRLLDAALAIMGKHGTTARVRVADIVAAAGVSNDTFYRHFSSKDALVVALLEDGTERLAGYIAHQMSKESTAERQVRRWVEGVLSQTREEAASTTLAVLWNGSSIGTGVTAGRHNGGRPAGRPAARAVRRTRQRRPGAGFVPRGPRHPGQGGGLPLGPRTAVTTETEHIARFCIGVATP